MSQQYPNLNNAPITEALIDFHIKSEEPVTNEALVSVVENIKGDYPNIEERRAGLLEVPFEKAKEVHIVEQGVVGYVLRNKDNTQAIQVMRDRLAVSRLKPYQGWEQLRDEAIRIWGIYCKCIKPDEIERIAVRYINRLEIPSEFNDFKEYLTCPPEVPEKLPQGMASFLLRIVIPNINLEATANVHQVLEGVDMDKEGNLPEVIPVILDIDVFKLGHFEPMGDSAWTILEALRGFKNEIFFESITPNMLELIK